MRRKLWIALLAAAFVAAASGYWFLSGDGRLLNNQETGGGLEGLCVRAKSWPARRTIGQAVLKNAGKREATITGVSLIEPLNVELLGVIAAENSDDIYLGDGEHVMAIGSDNAWPPSGYKQPKGAERLRGWDERAPAEGYVVEPGKEVIFVYGVRATGPAITKGLRVEYSTWSWRSRTADVYPNVTIVPDCGHERKYVDLDRLDDED